MTKDDALTELFLLQSRMEMAVALHPTGLHGIHISNDDSAIDYRKHEKRFKEIRQAFFDNKLDTLELPNDNTTN